MSDTIQMSVPAEPVLKPIECNQCGQCCKAFTLPWKPERLEANRVAAQKGEWKYKYIDEYGDEQSENVHAMMAVWAEHLTPVDIPANYNASRFQENEVYQKSLGWYSCGHLQQSPEHSEEVPKYLCSIHENRPYVCIRFKPDFQGGYLYSKENLPYDLCSYKTEWPSAETLEALEKVKSNLSLSDANEEGDK